MKKRPSPHPDWLHLGAAVIVRRTAFTGRVDHERVATVTGHTPKGVTVDGERFVLRRDRYVLIPKYLDYHTFLAPQEPTP